MRLSKGKEVFSKPYIFWFIGIFILYIILVVVISEFYITLQYIPRYLNTVKWSEIILGVIFTLIIAFLVSMNSVLGYIKFKQRQNIKKSGVLACVGAVGGFATGVCSVCVSGLFPFLFALFGVTFTWTFLPFNGLEVQLLVILILGISLYLLTKNNYKKEVKK